MSGTSQASFQRILSNKTKGKQSALLTAYDASMARLCEEEGIDAILVGDSLGHCIHGQTSTVGVTLQDLCYHVKHVRQGAPSTWILADLPFSHTGSAWGELYRAAVDLLQAGANMIKLEGGAWLAETVARLVKSGIPVCGHIGLWPQHVNLVGGYKVQGRDVERADIISEDLQSLVAAGISMVVIECVPMALAKRLRSQSSVPTIGIGAGPDCDGQILVIYDALGFSHTVPRFVRCFASQAHPTPREAITAYCQAVRDTTFPSRTESYSD